MSGVQGSEPQDINKPTPDSSFNNLQQAKVDLPQSPQVNDTNSQQAQPQPSNDDGMDTYFSKPQASAQPHNDGMDSYFSNDPEDSEPADVMTRIKAGFAGNENEKKAYLEQQYGKDNVRTKDDALQFKKDGKWHPFNAKYDVSLGDVYPTGTSLDSKSISGDPANLVRQGTVEAAALPTEALGAGAGPAGVAAGRFAGGAVGEGAARLIGYGLLGIPRSGSYSQDAKAMAEQGGIRAIFGAALDKVSKGIAPDAVEKEANDMVSSLGKGQEEQANAVADAHDTNLANGTPKDEANAATLDRVLKLDADAKKAGVTLNPAELSPMDPVLQAKLKASMNQQSMQDAQVARGSLISKILDGIRGEPVDQSANKAVLNASIADDAYGKLIGNYRKNLLDSDVEHVDASKTSDALDELRDMFGFTKEGKQDAYFKQGNPLGPKYSRPVQPTSPQNMSAEEFFNSPTQPKSPIAGQTNEYAFPNGPKGPDQVVYPKDNFRPPDAKSIQDIAELHNMSPSDAKILVNQITKLNDAVVNNDGKLTPQMLDQTYNLSKQFINARDPGFDGNWGSAAKSMMKIKDSVRDDFANGIGSAISDADQPAYQAAMDRFSTIKSNSDKLKGLFKQDSPSSSDIVQYLTAGGAGNADRIAALKNTIQPENPDGWTAIGQAYFDKLLAKHTVNDENSALIGNINWRGLNKAISESGKGSDQLGMILGQDKAEKLQALANAGMAIQNKIQPFEKPGLVVKLFKATAALGKADPELAIQIYKSDKAARDLLDSDATQKLIKQLSPKEQEVLSNISNITASQLKKVRASANALRAVGTSNVMQNNQQQQGPQQ